MISLVDSHAHIHGSEFDSDRLEVIERATSAGVQTIVTAGTDVASSAAAVALAESVSSVWATVGIHPHEAAASTPADDERLAALAGSGRVVAIGEIGLDFHYDHSPRDRQLRTFEEQLELADRLRLPVVVHSRDADADTFAVLSAWSSRRRSHGYPAPFGLLHCYAYGPTRAREYAALGLLISIAGIVTYPRAAELQQAAAVLEADQLLIETDCPYLAPQSRRGRRNEPALLIETAKRIADLRGTSLDALAECSTANARRVFGLS